jgi:hypothetical protein
MIGAPRRQYGRRQIDHWRFSESHYRLRRSQRGRGQVGIADGIEHHLMLRQRHFGIVELGRHHERLEDAIVQQMAGRYIAAHR